MQRSSMLLRILLCLTFFVAFSNVQGRPASEDSESDGYYETTYYYNNADAKEESESSFEMSDDSSYSYSSSGSSWSEGQSEDQFSESQQGQKGRRAKGGSSQMKEMNYESEGGSTSGSERRNKQNGGNKVDNASSDSKSSKGGNSSSKTSYDSGGGYDETYYSSQESMSEAEKNNDAKRGSHRRRSSSMSRTRGQNGSNNNESQSTDVAKGGSKNRKTGSTRSESEYHRTSEEESSFDDSNSNQRNKQSSRQSTSITRRGMNGKDKDSDNEDEGETGNMTGRKKERKEGHGGKHGGKKPHHKPGDKNPSGDDNDSKHPGKKPTKHSGDDKSPHEHGKKPGHHKDKKPDHPKHEEHKPKHGKPGKDSNGPHEGDHHKGKPKPDHDGKKPHGSKDKPKPGSDKPDKKKKHHKHGGTYSEHSSEEDDSSDSSKTSSQHKHHHHKSSEKSGHGGKPGDKKPHHKPGDKNPSGDDNDSKHPGKKPTKHSGDDKSPHEHGKKPGHHKDKKPDHPKHEEHKPKHGKPGKDSNGPHEGDHHKGKPGKKPDHPKDEKHKPKHDKPGKDSNGPHEGDHPKGKPKDSNKPDNGGKTKHHEDSDKNYKCMPRDRGDYPEKGSKHPSKDRNGPKERKPKDKKDTPNDSDNISFYKDSEEDDSSESSETSRKHTRHYHKSSEKYGFGGKPRDKKHKRKHGNKPSYKPGKKEKHHKPGSRYSENSSEEDDSSESSQIRNRHTHRHHKSSENYLEGGETPDDQNSKPKSNRKKPTRGKKGHPTREIEDSDSSYSSENDYSSDNSVKSHKDHRHRHTTSSVKGKHDKSNKKGKNVHHRNKHEGKSSKDKQNKHKPSKHGKTPNRKHKHPKHKKHLKEKEDDNSDESDEEHKGKGLKHIKQHKKSGKDRKTPEKSKHKPSKEGKKPKNYHRRSKKTGANSYHSSEEFDSSDESENNVHRKHHKHRSFDRRGHKGGKKDHGHHKHKHISKKGHKDDVDKMKHKHNHGHRGEKKGKHWNKKGSSSDSDEVDNKKGKHTRHHTGHKRNKKGDKHHHPVGDKKRNHKNKPSKPNDRNHRGSRHSHKAHGHKSHPKQKKINHEKNYYEIKKLLEHVTFEDLRRDKKSEKKFYQYFNFHVESKSVFKFIKFCFLYSKTPNNFGKHFSSILKIILEKKFDEIPLNYYTKFMTKVFGKHKKDFGKKYTNIYQFFKDLTFEDLQVEENMGKFYSYFSFYVETETVFQFMKQCFRSPKKPADFDTKFSMIWNIVINTDFDKVIKIYQETFISILFGKNYEDSSNNKDDDDSNSNKNNDIDYESKYEEIRLFFEELTFEKFQRNKKLQKNFYRYFRFNVKSKSVFRFIKFCFQYSKKPTHFGKHFSSILKIILEKKFEEVPHDYYTNFMTKVFGKHKKEFRKTYKKIHLFLKDITFEELQYEENMEKFYSYFNFYVESEEVFEFIKQCFRSHKKPVDFDTKFSSILNIIIHTDFHKVVKIYHKTFINILFENTRKNNQNKDNGWDKSDENNNKNNGGDKSDENNNKNKVGDESNENNNKNDGDDYEKNYSEIREFIQDLSFEEFQSNENMQTNFYKYFHFYAKSKSVFKFIKFCFQYAEIPNNFGKNFLSILKIILNKKLDEIPNDYYTKFITKVFGTVRKDFGKQYESIQQFLKDLSFEDLQTDEYMERFYGYFNFYVESENVFQFIKYCFQNSEKPNDFETKFSSIWNIIINTDFSQIIENYYTIFTNIIVDINSNNEDDNQDREKYDNKNTNKDIDYNDFDTNYLQINQFLSKMTFEELQNEENLQTFYSFFNFYVESESVFNFIKFCFQDSEQRSNFGIQFNAFLSVILNLDEISDEYYTMFTNNLSIYNNGYKFNFSGDYESIYKFLIDISFAELQTKENWEKFYSFFKFCPVSENMFDFIKFCFQYSEKPANLEINFQTVINAIFKSNFEINLQFQMQFAKYLFGESQMHYKDNYETVYQFMIDLTFEEIQVEDNWDTFYYYFQFYPTSESLFNLMKYCYQYEQKPTNFDINFKLVLKAVFGATSDDVPDNFYNLFTKNLFNDDNNNQQDFGANYVNIYKFLINLKFEDVQTDENSQKFYSFFNFYPKSESIFEFMKYCFQYSDKPVNFEKNFAKAINAILSSDLDEISSHFYTQFSKNLFGGQKMSYKGKYEEVYKFLRDLKFEDVDSPDNWNLFYNYFECYPVSASFFDFIKFCFRYEVEPVNFQTNFQNCLNIMFDSDVDEVSIELYITFIKNLFKGNIYKAIYYFMRNFTFEEAEQPFIREIFHYYFQFYPQSESLYNFMKYCFQYADKPINFEKNFQATLGAYLESGDELVSEELYTKFKTNLFGEQKEGQTEWLDFGFNKMFDKDNNDQNDEGDSSSWGSESSWSYTSTSDDQGGSSNDNSGNDQSNNQYSEWYYSNN